MGDMSHKIKVWLGVELAGFYKQVCTPFFLLVI